MLNGRRIAVVMPAYKAEKTLRRTFDGIPYDVVDHVILTDDASGDATAQLAQSLGIRTLVHDRNRGYGANQKTCYLEALRLGADVVVMLHPDYQYEPRLVTPMASMISSGVYDMVLGSRILGGTAMAGGMPLWKYAANRALTAIENMALGSKLSEFHTGFRAYSRDALLAMPILANSDDFVFDNQLIAQAVALAAHRRDLVPDLVPRRRELDQFLALGALWLRRAGDFGRVSRVAHAPRAPAHLRRARRGPAGIAARLERLGRGPFDQQQPALAVGLAQRLGLLVFRRVPPFSSGVPRREFDDHAPALGPFAFEHLRFPTPDEETSAVFLDGRGHHRRVFLVALGIGDLDLGDDIGDGHVFGPYGAMVPGTKLLVDTARAHNYALPREKSVPGTITP
ncbi:MAG TPA: glycosyltransferase family 2 protein [Usitatibacter sp.]|nr:glycosyltransferase family 2 protein [Usitatibacter sp.]